MRKRIQHGATKFTEEHGGGISDGGGIFGWRGTSIDCASGAGSRPRCGRLEGGSAIPAERKRSKRTTVRLCSAGIALPPSRAQGARPAPDHVIVRS